MTEQAWKQQYLGSWKRDDGPVVFLDAELSKLLVLGYDQQYVNELSQLEWRRPGTEYYRFKNPSDLDISIEHVFRLKQQARRGEPR